MLIKTLTRSLWPADRGGGFRPAHPEVRLTLGVTITANAQGTPPYGGVSPHLTPPAGWWLTREISPRPAVRLAVRDASGEILNAYPPGRDHHVLDDEPDVPWAVYLADAEGYRFLGFDFDAGRGDPARDAAVLSDLLTEHGIAHLIAQSGPTGGRHVWVALTDSLDVALVDELSVLVRKVCPSLDRAPLANPATGCLRPPGSPHRHGGTSTPISGSLDVLTRPSTTPDQVRGLYVALDAQIARDRPTRTADALPVATDTTGHPYLPGARRPLPPTAQNALQTGEEDASHALWVVLIGAAAAHWKLADVAELVATAPGMEYVRTRRHGNGRRPRHRGEQRRVLTHHWQRAVRWVADHPTTATGGDTTFPERAGQIADLVRHVQRRADAQPGRWQQGRGPSTRRVLDALCVLVLQAVRHDVQADVRRLGLLAGVGRETARLALHALAEDGWITATDAAEGRRATRWALLRQQGTAPSTGEVPTEWSQVLTRPAGTGQGLRAATLAALEDRLSTSVHDVFTPRGLGLVAGDLYAKVSTDPAETGALAREAGRERGEVRQILQALAAHRLVRRLKRGWVRTSPRNLGRAARELGTSGVLADRAARYALEREQYVWWLAEEEWMRAPRRTGAARRPQPGQGSLLEVGGVVARPAYPRGPDRRADHRAARALLAA